jgi:hypothetical protein
MVREGHWVRRDGILLWGAGTVALGTFPFFLRCFKENFRNLVALGISSLWLPAPLMEISIFSRVARHQS